MRLLTRCLFCITLLFGDSVCTASAQSTQKEGTGVITGLVTIGEKSATNVAVVLYQAERGPQRKAIARDTTDSEGRYKLTSVPAGHYSVFVLAPAMVGPNDARDGAPGKSITIAEGETVEKVDFALVRGGVITGRVTDSEGLPVIGEHVQINSSDKQRGGRVYSNLNPYMYQTDDRGVYRLYGIPPGKYTISIGEGGEAGSIRFGSDGRGYYARTFHPNVIEESKATVIEVAEGSEASNIDITLGRKAKSYLVTGRVLDEAGEPVANLQIGCGSLIQDGSMGGFGWGSISDAQGRFRIDGLLPGRYAAFVWTEGNTSGYSDPVKFEIADGDVSGLELKLRRGSTMTGVVVIEGTTDRSVLAQLSQLSLIAIRTGESQRLTSPNYSRSKIAVDGSFSFAGLQAGKYRLVIAVYPPPKGFSLGRVERDGVIQPEIEIAPGAQVTGLRVFIEYGNGRIRGLVRIEGGTLPDGARLIARARPVSGDTTLQLGSVLVDSRGHFLIEGLPPGEYEVIIEAFPSGVATRQLPMVKQRVSVTNGVESEVILTLNPNAKQPEGGNNE